MLAVLSVACTLMQQAGIRNLRKPSPGAATAGVGAKRSPAPRPSPVLRKPKLAHPPTLHHTWRLRKSTPRGAGACSSRRSPPHPRHAPDLANAHPRASPPPATSPAAAAAAAARLLLPSSIRRLLISSSRKPISYVPAAKVRRCCGRSHQGLIAA
mgnify:CR=1 FL=1